MTENEIARALWRRAAMGLGPTSPLAKALIAWARPLQAWLTGAVEARAGWVRLNERLAEATGGEAMTAHAVIMAQGLGELLGLEAREARFLRLCVSVCRRPRLAALAKLLCEHGLDVAAMVAELAGAAEGEGAQAARRSPSVSLRLLALRPDSSGGVGIDTTWTLDRLLDRASSREELGGLMIGARQEASLSLDEFEGLGPQVAALRALLAGACREGAAGINILLYGPPGVGKTELARALASAADLCLYSVGEADEDGEEPLRWERLAALRLAQKALPPGGRAVLLFDEFEDLVSGAGGGSASGGGWPSRREGSKLFINRMLETNPVPVIWTSNAMTDVDPAILRRFSFILHMDLPGLKSRRRMLERISAQEGVAPSEGLSQLVAASPQAGGVLRVAARVGRLAGDGEAANLAAGSLVRALRGGVPVGAVEEAIDPALIETDLDLGGLIDCLRRADCADASLLLTGPPGTGKTGLAHHLAEALDRPLIVRRASDLLSKWLGETEGRIAQAFEQARVSGGVLLFDEVDSLLRDRSGAEHGWEVTPVNELLTWLDRHPLPVIAATNHPGKLDPAALRRFVFKLELRPLGPEKAERAFARFFGGPAPAGLAGCRGLTLGDFAVVARQMRFMADRSEAGILQRLAAEAACRPERRKIGFGR